MPDRGIRIGVLSFLNAYPVYAGLALTESATDPFHFSFEGGVPSPVELNRRLAAGDLEVSPSSSVEVWRDPGRHTPAPGLSISSEGPVGSVFLFSRVPLRELAGGTVALPGNSATSVALLDVLCREHWRIAPRFLPFSGPPRLEDMLAGHDAALVIGDEAIRAAHETAEAGGVRRIDLGQAWFEFTGLPMVFALWAFRAEWAAARPEAFRWASARLLEARRAGLEALPEDIPLLAASRGLPEAVVAAYYTLLDYRFEAAHRRSLDLFLQLAGRAGGERKAVAAGER